MIDTRNTEVKSMESFQTDRRYKIAYVSYDLLINFLTTSITTGLRYAKIASEAMIPEDAKVAHVSYDFNRQCLAVILYHESFDEVPPGMEVPAVCNGLIEYQIVKVVSDPVDSPAEVRVKFLEETLDEISREFPVVLYGGEASGKQQSIAQVEFLLECYELSKSPAHKREIEDCLRRSRGDDRELIGKCE